MDPKAPKPTTNAEHLGVDAAKWAQAFCWITNTLGYKAPDGAPIDEGWMVCWFANAIEQAREYGRQEVRNGSTFVVGAIPESSTPPAKVE